MYIAVNLTRLCSSQLYLSNTSTAVVEECAVQPMYLDSVIPEWKAH